MLMSMDYRRFLDRESSLHQSADLLRLSECQQCGFCCLRKPCIPTPEELMNVAGYLGLTPARLVETKMVIDVRVDGGIYYPIWAQETQLDLLGKFLPYYRTYDFGYCIMFSRETGACLIHSVRPKAARTAHCWIEPDPTDTQMASSAWADGKLLEICPTIDLREEDDLCDEDDE